MSLNQISYLKKKKGKLLLFSPDNRKSFDFHIMHDPMTFALLNNDLVNSVETDKKFKLIKSQGKVYHLEHRSPFQSNYSILKMI